MAAAELLTYDAEARKARFEVGRRGKWLHLFSILAAGFALISDGYQNNVMSMLNRVFRNQYGEVAYSAEVSTRVSNASLVGTIIGQVGMGFACDYMGRKWGILVATVLLVLGSVLCAVAYGNTAHALFMMLTVTRGVVGVGIGAEYPSSSVAANEAANEYSERRRGGIMVMVTNLPLSLGGPFATAIFLVVYSILGSGRLVAVWRTMFALGCIWPISVFYFRWKLASNELFESGRMRSNVPVWLIMKYCWRSMIGTCGAWFLYDFVTFPNGIFSGTIIASVIGDSDDLIKIAEWNLLLGVLAIPGVLLGAFLCDRIGRKYTLVFGFTGYIIFGLIIGCAYTRIMKIVPLFIIFYALMLSLANAGPGDMLGVVSSESFPTPVRGTCYGISAAIGKLGAVVGTESFQPIRNRLGPSYTFIIAAICGILGVVVSWIFVPHLREQDLMENDIKFYNYLLANGWTGSLKYTKCEVRDNDSSETDTGASLKEPLTVVDTVEGDKKP
ncbi:AaceriAER386Wp [[Ashbya] aceris (nom. inval.)]|nr:AaceriAER386Wp [[Ashbya] aceris (nom. inval.)]